MCCSGDGPSAEERGSAASSKIILTVCAAVPQTSMESYLFLLKILLRWGILL
jgi:hypothetical protein